MWSTPAITFQWLDLEHFGLSDDLYIKMNARGKPLTAFETFKARYEQELAEHFGTESRSINGQSFLIPEFVARRMDNAWSDLFWAHRDPATNLYDSAVMNVFRAVALVTRDPEDSRYTEENPYTDDIVHLRDPNLPSSYSEFEARNWLNPVFTRTLIALLEVWSSRGGEIATLLPNTRYFDEKAVFEKLAANPTSLTFVEVGQFAAYASFIREHEKNIDPQAFQEWMRVVFNLSVNSTYDRPSELQRSILGLKTLLPQSEIILQHFARSNVPVTGFFQEQIIEEKLKAELILAHEGWRPCLDRAESHGYFRGQIGFLLDFSGALASSQANPLQGWDNAQHLSLQEQFERYLKKAEAMFGANGLNTLGDYRWQRALLSIGDYLLHSGQNHSFLVNSSTDPTSWKRLLRNAGTKRQLLKQLWDGLTDGTPLQDQLDQMIADAVDLEPWREAFVQTKVAIEYCEKQLIRQVSPEKIYLLKKSQMNGAHAELFSYCLYQQVLRPLVQKKQLEPLILGDYQTVNGTEEEPHVLLEYFGARGGLILTIRILFWDEKFQILIDSSSHKSWTDFANELCNTQTFIQRRGHLEKVTKPTSIKKSILDVVQAVTKHF